DSTTQSISAETASAVMANTRRKSSARLFAAILQGLHRVLGPHVRLAGEVGDGPRDPEHTLVRAGREAQALDGPNHDPARLRRDARIAEETPAVEPRIQPPRAAGRLPGARLQDPRADGGGGFTGLGRL